MISKIKNFLKGFHKKFNNPEDVHSYDLDCILYGRIGGKTTETIINCIIEKPYSPNQLSKELHFDLSTIVYHLKILEDNGYIANEPFENKSFYYPTNKLITELQ